MQRPYLHFVLLMEVISGSLIEKEFFIIPNFLLPQVFPCLLSTSGSFTLVKRAIHRLRSLWKGLLCHILLGWYYHLRLILNDGWLCEASRSIVILKDIHGRRHLAWVVLVECSEKVLLFGPLSIPLCLDLMLDTLNLSESLVLHLIVFGGFNLQFLELISESSLLAVHLLPKFVDFFSNVMLDITSDFFKDSGMGHYRWSLLRRGLPMCKKEGWRLWLIVKALVRHVDGK
jgi:hypothetical protein